MRKDWSELVRLSDERTGTLEEFANEKKVSKSALSYHITRRNKLSKGDNFIPVVREVNSLVVIEFPSGIKLTVQG